MNYNHGSARVFTTAKEKLVIPSGDHP